MVPKEDILEYRVGKLEEAVSDLSNAVTDLRDFLLSIKVWVRVAALAWGILQIAIAALLVRLVLGQ